MARVGMAFRCFFKLLFGNELPAEAKELLPKEALSLPDAPSPIEVKDSEQKKDAAARDSLP